VLPRFGRREHAVSLLPFLEEWPHVGREVLDHRQIFKRPDFELAAGGDLGDMGAAGPPRVAGHGPRAGAADADAAGETIRQCRIDIALDERDHVKHGLALALRYAISLIAAVRAAAPQRYRKFRIHSGCRPRGVLRVFRPP